MSKSLIDYPESIASTPLTPGPVIGWCDEYSLQKKSGTQEKANCRSRRLPFNLHSFVGLGELRNQETVKNIFIFDPRHHNIVLQWIILFSLLWEVIEYRNRPSSHRFHAICGHPPVLIPSPSSWPISPGDSNACWDISYNLASIILSGSVFHVPSLLGRKGPPWIQFLAPSQIWVPWFYLPS